MIKHSISLSYILRQKEGVGLSLYDWIVSYCKRNKILLQKEAFPNFIRSYEILDDDRLLFSFKSKNQLNSFVREGNKKFPYFEFI